MNQTILPGPRTGSVRIPASKSQAHRLLICAALGAQPMTLRCDGVSADIAATARCLRALGADITDDGAGTFRIVPIAGEMPAHADLLCGESGSTLRFLLPVVGALGADVTFRMEGRLPERPLSPLDAVLTAHGMTIRRDGALLHVGGQLRPGAYELPGDVSSQYISGVLMALPRLPGESTLAVTGKLESAGYIAMTEDALHLSGICLQKQERTYTIPGGQTARLPARCRVEGDWSNAAFFLCMARSPAGVTVTGLASDSPQGDRAVLDVLRRFGADVRETQDAVTVRRGALHGVTIDAAPIPDLIPVLSVVAALADGQTQIVNAARLRLKESDRLESTATMLRALGAQVEVHDSGLTITGRKMLTGGTVDPQHDHRIAMAATTAACGCTAPVTVRDRTCIEKSYPRFWTDLSALKTVPAAENTELE
ncbi:MAG: 3-phosphoshikimate 1-carboxyvinyltransferase [Oscillospiraceae bacterium]